MFRKLINKFKFFSEIEKLNEENKKLKEKLNEKQDQINKTNAYYKKKIYSLKK